jgi:hypothetical protein
MANLGKAALKLAERGLATFPLKPRNKLPITKHGCLDATKDLDVVRAWWEGWPDCNIGLATGAKSGVWVLDIDGDDGEASLRDLEQRMGSLPTTVEVITGGGGRHLFFKLPDFDGAPAIKNTAGKLGAGLDTRGDGGYVVAPPSIHPSGKAYAWSVDTGSGFADPPAWLCGLLVSPGLGGNVVDLDGRRALTLPELAANTISAGSRNDTLARLAGHLLRLNVSPADATEIALGWNVARCQPPLPDGEVINTVASIATLELKRRAAR